MRPKTAGSRKVRKQQNQLSTSNKKKSGNQSILSYSKVSSRYTSQPHTWQIKTEKLRVCNDPKNIALIHAYQPHKLKQCIVTDVNVYKKFYNNLGKCQLANLYTKSFLAHFRQWKKSLRVRVTDVISMLVQTKKSIDPQQIRVVLTQLQGIAEELKSGTQAVFNSKNVQSSNKARQLHQNFEHMQQYIKHLIQIVLNFCEYTKQINRLLQEGTQKNELSIKAIQKKVKKIHKQYQNKILQPLHFCTTHPQSNFMNRTQYKIKMKFDSIAKQAIQTLESIFKLTHIISKIQQKTQQLKFNQNKPEQYTVDNLNQMVGLLNTYQEYSLNDSQHTNQEQIGATKSHQILFKLKGRVREATQQIINIYRQKTQFIFKNEYKQIKQQTALSSMKDYANTFKLCKKKMLLLAKVFNKRRQPQYYEILSNFIKQNSQNFQNITQVIQKLVEKTSEKRGYSRDRISNIVESILPLVLSYQQNKTKICNSLIRLYTDPSQTEINLNSNEHERQSKMLKRYLQIMKFSQSQLSSLISVPRYQYKPNSMQQNIGSEQIQKLVESNIQQLYLLERQVFQNAKNKSNQLNKLINEEFILKFVSFSDDIMRQPIHSFQVFRQFYQKMYGHDFHNKKISKQSVNHLIQYFEQVMKKCEAFRNEKQAKKFIQWMFQNRMAIYVINNMKKMKQIMELPLNNEYWSKSEKIEKNKLCFRMNNEIKQYFVSKQQLLKQMVESSKRYVGQNSIFDYYFVQCHRTIAQMIKRQQIYQQFDNSAQTGAYWATSKQLCSWHDFQFSYYITKDLNQIKIKQKRSQFNKQLKNYLKKLNELIQKEKQRGNKFLGVKFIKQCKKKIKDIQQLLIPFTKVQNKKNQQDKRIANFNQLSKSMITYMVQNRLYHIGLLTNSQQPLFCISCGDPDNYQLLIKSLEQKLKLEPLTIQRNDAKSRFVPFQIRKILKINQNPSNIQAPFILQDKKINKAKQNTDKNKELQEEILDQLIEQEQINDQINQSIAYKESSNIVEFIIESPKKKNNKKQVKQDVAFILQDQKITKNQNKAINPSFILNSQSQMGQTTIFNSQNRYKGYDQCVYYKVKQLQSLKKVLQCVKAAQVEHELIKNQLKILTLALAFQQKQPNQQLIEHLNHILNKASHNNFYQILNKDAKLSKNQQLIQSLKLSLNQTGNYQEVQKRRQKVLKQVFEFLNYKFEYILDEGKGGNKLIVCEVSKKESYGHAILNKQYPFTKQNELVKDDDIVKVQNLFLRSLLAVPYQKNRHLDEIISEIDKINNKIKLKYRQLRQQLEKYKNYPLNNKQQIEKIVMNYINKKTNNQLCFSNPSTIDYSSLKKFLKQYELICKSNPQAKIYKILVNSNPQLPLFYSSNQQQIKNITKANVNRQGYSLLPDKYSGSQYVQRNSVESVNIKYQEIVNEIMSKQLNAFNRIQAQQILEMLYQSSFDKQKQNSKERLKKKLNDFFATNNANDFRTVANICKTIGEPEVINDKVSQLENQRQLLSKIQNIHKQNATFILQDQGSQASKQAQFIQPVEESPSFILQKKRSRQQIQPHLLQQFQDLLNKLKIDHKVVKYKGAVVGLVQPNLSAEMAIKQCLDVKESDKIKFKQNNNKQIQVQQLLFIQLVLSQRLKESLQLGKQKIGQKIMESYSIQINNQISKQVIVNIHKLQTRPAIVRCKYPKKPIQLQLKRKNADSNKISQVMSLPIKYYQYGSRYNLTGFQNQIIKEILIEYNRVKQQQERIQAQILRKKQDEENARRQQQRRKQQEEKRRLQEQKTKEQEEKNKKQEQRQKQQDQKRKLEQEKRKQQQERKREQEEKKRRQLQLNIRRKIKIIKNRLNPKEDIILYFCFEQGDKVDRIEFGKLKEWKIQSTNQDCLSQISIILSQNYDIDRDKLIKNNQCYHFHNIKEVISGKVPHFILEE